MKRISLLVLLGLSYLYENDGAKILAIIPTPSVSHQIVFRPLTQELSRRGHHVDIITADPAFPKGQAPENLTEIDVHDLSYEIWWTNFMKRVRGKNDDFLLQFEVIFDAFNEIVEKQLHTADVRRILKRRSDYYDLLLIEACVRPALVFSHVFKAPVILVSSMSAILGNYEVIGAPVHPLLYPLNTRRRIFNLTQWEKLTELYEHYSLTRLYDAKEVNENAMIERVLGPGIPPISELKNNIDMLFLNIHPVLEGNKPVPPSVIYMWGIHKKPQQDISNNLKMYLEESKSGVIYMSFGTNTNPSNLGAETIKMFLRVFSQLPYDILLKWDSDNIPGISKNVRVGKWFPQSDLLRHPKIKLFITQGGLQSTDEAINAGVPLLGIPMLADQWYNTEKYVYHKIGLKLDLETLNDHIFKNAINTVINDESYRRNIERLRGLVHDQPMPPLQWAVWWAEHVIRHGGARHLRSPAANITWAQYLELELVLILLLASVAALVVLGFVLYVSFSFVTKNFVHVKLKYS